MYTCTYVLVLSVPTYMYMYMQVHIKLIYIMVKLDNCLAGGDACVAVMVAYLCVPHVMMYGLYTSP